MPRTLGLTPKQTILEDFYSGKEDELYIYQIDKSSLDNNYRHWFAMEDGNTKISRFFHNTILNKRAIAGHVRLHLLGSDCFVNWIKIENTPNIDEIADIFLKECKKKYLVASSESTSNGSQIILTWDQRRVVSDTIPRLSAAIVDGRLDIVRNQLLPFTATLVTPILYIPDLPNVGVFVDK